MDTVNIHVGLAISRSVRDFCLATEEILDRNSKWLDCKMECDSDNVTETEKYAFLLGSALRNEDTDQFISIYDSIIPQNLPDSQLESIKDKARVISELAEAGFNDLVSRARNFSLAPAGSMSSTHARWTNIGSSEDEDEGVSSVRQPGAKSDTSSLYSATKQSCESDTPRLDNDSGLCNSSKATNSIGSLSDGSDNENHQHFDYFPSHPQVKIRSGGGLLLDYDEVHSVHSDNSSDDIISPRSDISDKTFENGVEMQTLRRSHDVDDDFSFQHVQRGTFQQQDDFNTDDDSEDDERRSYRSPYTRNTSLPVHRESTSVYKPKFDASRSHWESSSSLRNRGVDDTINFSSLKEGTSPYSRYSSYQSVGSTASSEKVKIEKNSYKKEPPFGKGVDQLHKVAQSITPLISGYPGDQEVENLPAARKLEVLTSEDTKKRKKRKKGNKDEPHTDENGNPVEALGLTPSSYRQMRESPSPVLGGPTSKNRHTSELSTNHGNQYGTFPNFDPYPSHANSELEDGSSKSQDRRKQRKKREEKKEDVKRSEDVQDYVGDKKSIAELLEFIDGNHAGVKKSKKLVSKIVEDIPIKANKTKHKNKDKKQKSPTPSNSIEEIEEKGDNSAQIASLEKESYNMGNTGGKTETEIPDEIGDSENVSVEKEALNNDLLKQDNKINNKSDKNNKNDRRSKSVSNSIISSQTSVIKSDIGIEKCEKQKTKETMKSGIKKETAASGSSEKKKVEKPLTKGSNKAEKPELTNSKSDDSLVRADSSASMSVKQKNAKNKKSKPQSLQAAKDEGNTDCIEGSNKATAIPAITNEGLIDNNFIFTDLDVPLVPKEDEFRVVGKKKKKVTTKEIQPNHYINNGNNNKSFSRFYDDKRSFIPSNGNNKLPQSNVISTAMESDNRMRDLSPSSFPALCSNERERQSLKDGRRNSTGDVPIPSEVLLKSQDDSDMESVKSLPATQGGRAADPLSPRLNVSYARMAACPKPDDGYQSPGEKSPDIDSTDDIDRKVWKGSPTERRHSIGSSLGVITSTTNSPALGLKTGSSEVFVVDAIESKSDSIVFVANGPRVHCVQQSKSDDVIVAKKEVNLMNENCNIAKQCAIVIPTVQQKTPNSLQDTYYNSNIKNIKHERGTKITSENIEPKMNSMNYEKYSKADHSSSISSRQYIQKSVSKTNNNSIPSKKIKQQSVIFLDRRLAEAPENLGITFGFEFEPLMNTVASDKKLEKGDSSVMSSNSKEDVTVLSEEPKVTFLSEVEESKPIVKDVDKVNSSSSSVILVNKTEEISDPVPSIVDDKNNVDLIQKVQSQLGRLNGVLSPPSQGQSVECDDDYQDPAIVEAQPAMENTIENSIENEIDAGSSTLSIESSPHNSNSVIVYFGESVATLKKDVVVASPTNGPTRYCGKVTHIVEAGEPSGNFNHLDVVNFLNTEWEKVQKLEKRDPAVVKVHGMG